MSSEYLAEKAWGFVGDQGAVDDIGEAPAKETQGLGLGVALLDALGDVFAAGVVGAGLGDGDPVQRGVDLAVAAAVEADACGVARAGGLRSGSVPARVGALGAKALRAGCLADELGGRQRAAAGDLEQGRDER